MKNKNKVILSRIFIGIVTGLNLQAAFYFMLKPERFTAGFELSGVPGDAMIQGMGLLFLMWNIPYLMAIFNPAKNFISLIEAVFMQAIGVIGETLILSGLEGYHPQIQASVTRFIVFDAGGLVLLLLATLLVIQIRRNPNL